MSKEHDRSRALELVAYGFSMGTANVIPGVSGGTMALIHGIYDELVEAINSADTKFVALLLRGRWKEAFQRLHWRFLVPLAVGVGLAVVSLAKVVPYLLVHYRAPVTAFFVGLILASAISMSRDLPRWGLGEVVALTLATGLAYWVVGLIPVQTPIALWFMFLCGFLSFMAMLLPGISGAFVLLVLGKYAYLLGLIRDLVYHLRFQALLPLFVFGLGALAGLVGLARIMAYLLEHARTVTMAGLIGLMLGSLRKLWPWREVVETMRVGHKVVPVREVNRLPDALDGTFVAVLVCLLAGAALVLVLDRLAKRNTGKAGTAGAGTASREVEEVS